ncbi:MAG: ABC transporter permease, partial [Paracoccaceae bacterium]
MWLPSYATPSERMMRILVVTFAVLVMLFLIAPLFIIVPLSFSKDPFFTLPVREYSLRWYADLFGNPRWMEAMVNSGIAAVLT